MAPIDAQVWRLDHMLAALICRLTAVLSPVHVGEGRRWAAVMVLAVAGWALALFGWTGGSWALAGPASVVFDSAPTGMVPADLDTSSELDMVWVPRRGGVSTIAFRSDGSTVRHDELAIEPDVEPVAVVSRPTAASAWIARVIFPTNARTRPGGRRVTAAIKTVAPWNGGPVGLLVLDSRRDGRRQLWLRVALPRRPNGRSGWIPARKTQLSRTPYRIEVSTRHRALRLRRAGRVVLRARAVIGAPPTPTPDGLFAVSERVRQPDPRAFLGTWALHLTAFSNVLDNYGGGPGQVAIHGRGGASLGDPLGTARSHGCIRVTNAVADRLARVAREGTPVRIAARFVRITRSRHPRGSARGSREDSE